MPAIAGKTDKKTGRKTKFNPKSFPISFPNLGKSENSHIKQKPYIVFGCTFLIQYMVSVAGVAGFEPTNDGVRVRCLTAWRHPNVQLTNHILSNLAEFSKRFCTAFVKNFSATHDTSDTTLPYRHLSRPHMRRRGRLAPTAAPQTIHPPPKPPAHLQKFPIYAIMGISHRIRSTKCPLLPSSTWRRRGATR